MENKNKAVVISGASSGIGRECAFHIAEAGFRVLAGVRSEKDADKLKTEAPGKLIPVLLDVTNVETIESVKRMVCSENLYGLINNAGIAVLGPFEFVPIEEIRRQFDVNFFGSIALTQALLPHLRRAGAGRIINISSISSQIAFPQFGPYAASKFAVEAFNDALRRELRPWDIQAVSIRPGNVSTPIWHKSLFDSQSISDNFPTEASRYYDKSPFNPDGKVARMSQPSAVAKTVLKALTAKKPKTHYLVGMDSLKFAILKWLLPDRLIDRIL
jgi:NAD(P)-dependent dehydrogenase (short-subunit alcohol dehydrogenase family)